MSIANNHGIELNQSENCERVGPDINTQATQPHQIFACKFHCDDVQNTSKNLLSCLDGVLVRKQLIEKCCCSAGPMVNGTRVPLSDDQKHKLR